MSISGCDHAVVVINTFVNTWLSGSIKGIVYNIQISEYTNLSDKVTAV
jgi:hypothetical protein